jgi:CDP-4-dehydro-6-deoxyglucose reductase, E1
VWSLAEDTLSHDDLDSVAGWLRSYPLLTQGEVVRAFEESWSRWQGCEYSVMVNSGSSANLTIILALSLLYERPLRVGVAAVTWPTTLTPSILFGQQVTVFDVSRETLGVETTQVVQAIETGSIDVLFVTHLLGFVGLTEEIFEACRKHQIVLLEDCCEAHGAQFRGAKVGTLGLAGSFSFYFGHHMSTIEGGMVSTNDQEFADFVRLVRSHGLSRESYQSSKYANENPNIDPKFLFVAPGLNLRSTELNAFLGLRQLKKLDEFIATRNININFFLDNLPSKFFSGYTREGMSSFALPILCETQNKVEKVRNLLEDMAIEYRPIVAGNLLRQPFMKDRVVASYPTPNSDWVHDHGVYVGNGNHLSIENISILLEKLGDLV